jgi:hypothetical protein
MIMVSTRLNAILQVLLETYTGLKGYCKDREDSRLVRASTIKFSIGVK